MNILASAAPVPPTFPCTRLAAGSRLVRTLVNAALSRCGFS